MGAHRKIEIQEFSNALLSFSVEHNLDTTQMFLVKGHTQMEVNSVHSVIERKIKKQANLLTK